jgi:hypothetical protein
MTKKEALLKLEELYETVLKTKDYGLCFQILGVIIAYSNLDN